ncbi:MAG: isocitrate dehydrogenase kinase/phosphatase [Candidatus Azotimanducaceae bacterium]
MIPVVAQIILSGFERYRLAFRRITHAAKDRFERAAWPDVQNSSTERIRLYKLVIREIGEEIDTELKAYGLEIEVLQAREWRGLKKRYQQLIRHRDDYELAQTVFNTFFRKSSFFASGDHSILSDEFIFLTSSSDRKPLLALSLTNSYGPSTDLEGLLEAVLLDRKFDIPFLDLKLDIALISSAMEKCIPLLRIKKTSETSLREISFEILKSVFYRNKGAYLIGHMLINDHFFPLAIPIHNNGIAVYADTIIWNENDLSVIFSFSRSYFMVETDVPSALVEYLGELLPNKKPWELYTAVGFYKHGKTEFYRSFLAHLTQSDDQFVIAEGIRGLVMCVFTLPSYHTVFKIIKDKFSPTKKVTRAQVKDAYKLVKTHDRVGRMADTQEFTYFSFPKSRFSEALIEELLRVAANSVSVTENKIIIKHLYTERLMTPMNLFMKGKSDFELEILLDEYGSAIKQLAAANIFPGDMLLKNFGVTRHGRVIFYDYDEICYLTEINFREIPKSQYKEDEVSAQPWFNVSPQDVFPEEFINFLFHLPKLREMFCNLHGELFTVEYWQSLQQNILQEQVMDVFPYRQNRRFNREEFTI